MRQLIAKRTENGGSRHFRNTCTFLPMYRAQHLRRHPHLNYFSYLISKSIPTNYINMLGYSCNHSKRCGYIFSLGCLFFFLFCFPKTAGIFSFSLSISASLLKCITPYSPFFRPCAEDWSGLEIILHCRSNKTPALILRAFCIWHPSRRRWAS